MSQLKHSVSWWCFAEMGLTPQQLLQTIADTGYQAVELIEPELWPLAKKYGLGIASTNGGLSIEQGLNRRQHHAQIERTILATIQQAEQWNIPNIIVFSGNRQALDERTGAEITAEGLGRVARVAEDAGVNLVMELLNSKVNHPDYQCDHTAWGVQVCQMVNSPRVKLLYDIYHMQIMEGDIISTIRTYHQYFAHYHTAGVPGRHEIGETQELFYPAIIRSILETDYDGYLGQEFIPQGEPVSALKQAFELCNIQL
jgi:hydroxypyruvate isomerase